MLADLQGDRRSLCELAQSYLSDLDRHLAMLISDEDLICEAAHRLRTAFSIFHASRGSAVARDVERICRAGEVLSDALLRSLLLETTGLGEELQRYLELTPQYRSPVV
ncbi:hypothetical protein [Chitinimonas lacunae]|uniref:Hpt domain-containing protein n=1 Tax=Chitinimonas lacunae TaxID=1963018 RepID=A0ABV8MS07_9NEIS